MIKWGKYSDDYKREGTLMITAHYYIYREWGLVLHYVINSLISNY